MKHGFPTASCVACLVQFPTAASGCVSVKRRTSTAVENSCTAVQHFTEALFLSKPVEPLLTSDVTGGARVL